MCIRDMTETRDNGAHFSGERTRWDRLINLIGGYTLVGLSTANDARNGQPLTYLLATNQLDRAAMTVLDTFARRPHVFNLGHGIDKETPIAHVERLLAVVRGWRG